MTLLSSSSAGWTPALEGAARALTSRSGSPEPALVTALTHFKDRHREVKRKLERDGAQVLFVKEGRPESFVNRGVAGLRITSEVNIPGGVAEAAPVVSALEARLLTPSMIKSGFRLASASGPATVGEVSLSLTSQGNKTELVALLEWTLPAWNDEAAPVGEPAEPPEEPLSVEGWMDALMFEWAYATYLDELTARGLDAQADVLAKRGLIHGRGKAAAASAAGLEEHVHPLLAMGNGSILKPSFRLAVRPGTWMRNLPARRAFYGELLAWLSRNAAVRLDLFKGRTAASYRALRAAMAAPSAQEALQVLASTPFPGGGATLRAWVKQAAAALAGAPLDLTELGPDEELGAEEDEVAAQPAEAAMALDVSKADAETALAVGEQLNLLAERIRLAPSDQARAELEADKAELQAELDQALTSADDPQATLAAVGAALAVRPPLPEFLAAQSFNDEQLSVVLAEGRLLINAGAGSGKSTSLAGKVAYAVKVKGVNPENILVTSFTVAASKEIRERIKDKYGIEGSSLGRTINSLGREVLLQHGDGEFDRAIRNTDNADKLLTLAWRQVSMPSMTPSAVPSAAAEVREADQALIRKLVVLPGMSYRTKTVDFLYSLADQLKAGRSLSPKQREALERIQGQFGRSLTASLSDEEDSADFGGPAATPSASLSGTRMAAPGEAEGKRSKAADSPWWDAPIGGTHPKMGWIHLGRDYLDEQGFTRSNLERAMSELRLKHRVPRGVQRDSLSEGGRAAYALWAAYEWLKVKDTVLGPCMDMDDQLIWSTRLLASDARAREAVQARYKLVLVDEAQDCNEVQNEFFRLLSGGAETVAFIGDDRQAIYGFRGARPDLFVGMVQDGFQMLNMETNYRSGSAIVQAGERLIAHNGDRQLPKVCKAYHGRGQGAVRAVDPGEHAQAAEFFGEEVARAVAAGDASPDDFGLVTRTNAEKDAFMMALLSRGIPYRSNGGGYFDKPAVSAVVAWLTVALSSDKVRLNKALATALDSKLPSFYLGGAFFEALRAIAGPRDYVTTLLADADKFPSSSRNKVARLAAFVGNLRAAAARGAGTTALLEELIRNMPGEDGKTLLQRLVERIDPDDLMAEGVELDSRGQVSAAVLEAAASAVLAPLLSLAAASPANQANPHAYLEVLDTLREANRKPAPGEEPPPSVQIDTCHQWKGLEAKKVFVLMSGNTWPPKPRPPAPGQEDEDVSAQLARHAERVAEERRLAYVAITRGRDEVVILSPNTDYLGRPVDEDSPFLAEAEVDFPEDDDAAEED